MRTLFSVLLIAAGLLLGEAPLAVAGQSSPQPPANDDCLVCHGDPEVKRANGTPVAVNGPAFAASRHGPMACVDCHADLATTTEFPHPEALKKVDCASCHGDIGATYRDSIHARAREQSGLNVAPACADCHGRHDILGKADPKSRVAHAQVPVTCGVCHDGIRRRYEMSAHAVALKQADPRAPVCSDCHTAHAIRRTDTDASRLGATAECGACHQSVAEAFTRTFHGKVTQLGSAGAAACANCHGAHDILPASDPASTVSPQKLQATCGSCHEGANASFVQYDPHPDPRDYQRSAALWWANRFYWVLIPGCFGFFGVHSLLWFWRAKRDARANQGRGR
ncbi:MAG: cytochrome c3 family protein [Acidobacteriota bacterium]